MDPETEPPGRPGGGEPVSPLPETLREAALPASRGASPSGDEPRLARGQSVGRYMILGEAGAGGMGVVYSAYDPELDRKVAVKVLRPRSGGTEGRSRLQREAQAMARISHANVIPVYDVGALGDQVFLAMEWVDGVRLDVWQEDRRGALREILAAYLEAGRGLAAAHRAGLVHRDFKPGNVLVGNDGRVRVMDFGLARAAAESEPAPPPASFIASPASPLSTPLTLEGSVLGTPAYMSPEQHAGGVVDARSDQFSFALALYEALYGQHPFAGSGLTELQQNVIHGRLHQPPPGSRVPGWIRRCLLHALRHHPAERYAGMEELLAELAADPQQARKRWLLAGGAVVALLGVLATAGALVRHRSLLCQGAERKLAGVWDPGRKETIRGSFLAAGLPFATDAWQGVERNLDAFSAQWVGQHVDACEATRLRGEQSEELLDLRMICLAGRREELRALTDLFAKADHQVVEKAVEAAAGLGPLSTCADAQALTGPAPPPADPELRARLERVQATLAEATALHAAGKYEAARSVAERASTEAKTLAYPPVEAEALRILGGSLEDAGHFQEAGEALQEAAWTAEAARSDRIAAAAAIELVTVLGHRQSRAAEAESWARHARALLSRSGGDRELEGRLLHSLGLVAYSQGRYEDASRSFEEALQLKEEALGPEDPTVANSLLNLGTTAFARGDLGAAATAFERALAIQQEILGPRHPDVANSLNNLGAAFSAQGDYARARDLTERALAIKTDLLGPDHPELCTSHNNLGELARLLGRYEEAHLHLDQAVRIAGKTLGPEHSFFSEILDTRGAVFNDQGRFSAALDAHREALGIRERHSRPDHPRLAYSLTGIGRALLGLRRAGEAVPTLERAFDLRSRNPADPLELAETRFALAQALWESGGDRQRARALAQAARQAQSEAGSRAATDLATTDAWLAAHRP